MNFDELVVKYDGMRKAGDKAAANRMLKNEGYTAEDILPALQYYQTHGEAIDYGTMDAFIQGASFGFSDEVSALASALPSAFGDTGFMEAYDKKVNQIRDRRDVFAAVNPGTALAAEMAGSVVTGMVLPMGLIATSARMGTKAAKVGTAAKAAARNAPLRTAASVGAAEGAVAGFGSGEGLGGSVLNAGAGAVMGGVGGVAGSALAGVAARAFRKADTRAVGEAANAFANDGVDFGQVRNQIQRNVEADRAAGLNGPQEMLLDYAPLQGNVGRLARGARTATASPELDDALRARASGDTIYSPNNQGRMGQSGRLNAQVSKNNLKAQTIDALLDQVDDMANTSLSKGYKAAFAKNSGVIDQRLFNTMVKVPRIKDAYEVARGSYNALRRNDVNLTEIPPIEKLFDKNGNPTTALPLRFLDLVKREAQDGIFLDVFENGKLTKSGSETQRQLVGEFTDELKSVVKGPEYKSVLKQAADKFTLAEAAEVGEKLMRMPAKEVKARLAKMDKNELEAVRIGMLEDIRDTLNKTNDATNLLTKLVGSPAARQKIDILFGDDVPGKEAFVERIKREVVFQVNKNFQTGGSNTADKTMDAQLLGTARELALGISDPISGVGSLLERFASKTRGQQTARGVQKILSDQNPQSQMETVDRLQRAQRANQTLGNARFGSGMTGAYLGGLLSGGYSDDR